MIQTVNVVRFDPKVARNAIIRWITPTHGGTLRITIAPRATNHLTLETVSGDSHQGHVDFEQELVSGLLRVTCERGTMELVA